MEWKEKYIRIKPLDGWMNKRTGDKVVIMGIDKSIVKYISAQDYLSIGTKLTYIYMPEELFRIFFIGMFIRWNDSMYRDPQFIQVPKLLKAPTMEQWEWDYRQELMATLPNGSYDISTNNLTCLTGKGGYIEYLVSLRRYSRFYNCYVMEEKNVLPMEGYKMGYDPVNKSIPYQPYTQLSVERLREIIEEFFHGKERF